MGSFWAEVKKRRVIRAAVVYVVVSWVVMQIADVVAPTLLLPDWVASFVTLILILGFPIALVLAWAYDLTPDGIKLTSSIDAEQRSSEAADQPASRENAEASRNSIAVLPFRNVTSDPENEYFSDGITEEVLSVLARVGSLRVAARTSCFHFKGRDESVQRIGKELGVSTIVEGSVRSQGETVRITAQLIDVQKGYQVWAKTFDRKLDNLLDVQNEIARSIVAAMQEIGPDDTPRASASTSSEEAFQSYLRGRYLWQRRDADSIGQGIELLRQAIGSDTNFAAAYATLAAAYHKLPLYDVNADGEACQRLAESAAREAIARDRDLVEGHATLASILADSHRYIEAEKSFTRALELGPEGTVSQHWIAIFQLNTGRIEKAFEHIRVAEQYDPLNGAIAGTYGTIAFALARTDKAIERYEVARQLGWSDAALAFLGAVHLYLGDNERAADYLRRGRFAAESIPEPVVDCLLAADEPGSEGWTRLGETLSDRVLSGTISNGLAFRLAALRGHPQVFDLEIDAISGDAISLLWLPGAAPLRQDSRFSTLAQRLGLPELWETSGWPDVCKPSVNGEFVCH